MAFEFFILILPLLTLAVGTRTKAGTWVGLWVRFCVRDGICVWGEPWVGDGSRVCEDGNEWGVWGWGEVVVGVSVGVGECDWEDVE